MAEKLTEKVIIMGAAGRDFHVFNTYFRDNGKYEVVCFTAAQIPDIDGRKYPQSLAGDLYPEGIPIYDEKDLTSLIKEHQINQVVFAYSDLSHEDIMHKASEVLAAGADFRLMGPGHTAIKSTKPLVSICAVRTGVGKSQTTIKVSKILRDMGYKVVSIRHPMPYGNLEDQVSQRYETYEDLDKYECTIEEREEYEPHIENGIIIYSGVDYQKILNEAEKEADIILWDGGNNDFPFYQSDFNIVLADALRPGHEITYHPGETNIQMADLVIINKIDTADAKNVEEIRANIQKYNPSAKIIEAASPIALEGDYKALQDKKVLVIEDGPTVTHGGTPYGAGYIAAKKNGPGQIIDPRPFACKSIKDTFDRYDHLEKILPAMGYGKDQIKDLEDTINATDADVIVSGTPIDITRVVNTDKPVLRTKYQLQEIGKPDLEDILGEFVEENIK